MNNNVEQYETESLANFSIPEEAKSVSVVEEHSVLYTDAEDEQVEYETKRYSAVKIGYFKWNVYYSDDGMDDEREMTTADLYKAIKDMGNRNTTRYYIQIEY